MRALAITLFAVLLTAGPAAAQAPAAPDPAAPDASAPDASATDPADLTTIYSAEVFQQSVIAMGRPRLDANQGNGQADAGADPAVQQALVYDPSPEVERRTRSKLLDSLMTSSPDPAVQAQIQKTVASDAIWLQFHQVLNNAGFSTTNLADVTAAYYIIAWEVVNSPDATVHAAGVRAVREDVAAAFAADPRLKDLTDADKQEAASIMAYMATLAAASANQLRSTGNQAALEQLQDQVHRAVLGQGLDLAQLSLTDEGFTAR